MAPNISYMNWIIEKSNKLRFHTNLEVLLVPIVSRIRTLKWFVSDLDLNTDALSYLPIGHDQNYYILDSKEMDLCRKINPQVVWGYLAAFDRHTDIKFDRNSLPYVEGNSEIWDSSNWLLDNSLIEMICWDSSYTIIKFKEQEVSDKWRQLFDEAIDLDVWTTKQRSKAIIDVYPRPCEPSPKKRYDPSP
ncbi:hypothetical protein LEM8419_00671 [Neolewinella maritima]|uniref:Uncharacterized protein n=2 Tax=Neolewinella maritima TaxID=1383882 RepID=A0ABM9AY02_9BACT|nr:hypothetical protein LEM8419_00671 [Neolewinella maritima]